MRIEVIYCPACQHKLRITDDLLGTQVQCPECRALFLAPPPPPGAALAPPSPAVQPPPLPAPREGYRDRPPLDPYLGPADMFASRAQRDQEAKESSAATWLTVMGVLLLGVSVLGLISGLFRIGMAFSPQLQRAAMQNNPFGNAMPNNIDPQTLHLVFGFGFGMLALASMGGALSMIRRNNYTLAIIGSITAMINIGDCCCLLGLPVGVGCLIVLLQPHVQSSFR